MDANMKKFVENLFATLLDGDGNLISVDEGNEVNVDAFLRIFVQFRIQRVRKTNREIESYEITNSSAHGWVTEQCNVTIKRIVSSLGGLMEGGSKWFDDPKEPPAKKVKRLFDAERAAASISRSRETKDDSDDSCDDY